MEIFDYDNILLLPRKCRVDSRAECDPSVDFGGRRGRRGWWLAGALQSDSALASTGDAQLSRFKEKRPTQERWNLQWMPALLSPWGLPP